VKHLVPSAGPKNRSQAWVKLTHGHCRQDSISVLCGGCHCLAVWGQHIDSCVHEMLQGVLFQAYAHGLVVPMLIRLARHSFSSHRQPLRLARRCRRSYQRPHIRMRGSPLHQQVAPKAQRTALARGAHRFVLD
jgi:hypothetical protein